MHRQGFIIIVLVQIHFIQLKQSISLWQMSPQTFQQISDLKIFPECFPQAVVLAETFQSFFAKTN